MSPKIDAKIASLRLHGLSPKKRQAKRNAGSEALQATASHSKKAYSARFVCSTDQNDRRRNDAPHFAPPVPRAMVGGAVVILRLWLLKMGITLFSALRPPPNNLICPPPKRIKVGRPPSSFNITTNITQSTQLK